MPEITCATCGKPRDVLQADLNRGLGKYCSRECYYASQRTRVEYKCARCGKPSYSFKGKMARGHGKYCSRACFAIARKKPDAVKANPAYQCWRALRKRCLNPKTENFKDYGGRGIKVCDRWMNSFENFLADMGERPEGMTVDRIDPNGNYTPDNCRWASHQTQARNRRNSITVNCGGAEVSLIEYAEMRGVKYHSLHARISRHGDTAEEAADHLRDTLRADRGVL